MAVAKDALVLELQLFGVAAGLLQERDHGRTLRASRRFGGDHHDRDTLQVFQFARGLGLQLVSGRDAGCRDIARGDLLGIGRRRIVHQRNVRQSPARAGAERHARALHVDDRFHQRRPLVRDQPAKRAARGMNLNDRWPDFVEQLGASAGPQLVRHSAIRGSRILARLEVIHQRIAGVASADPARVRIVDGTHEIAGHGVER